ncbi:uncharacterized protein LOC114756730 [Neltuma alba]|uniref:uncharacterized protein LOC114756730 n=3 Tax=Neltuma alba TaxID=207710 RepID=UPI0010A4173A|nr:uncharacterized protein LOC114756730 [Prosopis alba]
MAHDPTWKAQKYKKLFLPEFLGYNLAECDFIIGPALVGQHWFCVAIQPSTLDFHVIDSMRNHFGTKDRKQKKKVVIKDPVEMAVDDCRKRLNIILDLVKPGLVGKKPMSPMIFAEVPQQNNLRDCGVHCMMWLRRWEPGVTLTYTEEEVAGFRRDLTWWLVNHEQNEKRDEALALIRRPQPTKSTKSKKRRRS